MVFLKKRRVAGRRYPMRKRMLAVRRKYKSGIPSGIRGLGGFKILRKATEAYVYNTGVAGTFATNSGWLTIGAPSATPSGIANSYNLPFSASFCLSQVLNYGDISALADKYRINWVKIKVSCTSTSSATVNLGTQPNIHWITDEDDAAVPTSLSTFKEKMGIKSRYLANGRYTTIFIKPKPADMVYNLANGLTYAPMVPRGAQYINSSAPDVAHFGLKGYLEDCYAPANTSANFSVKFDLTMSITAKDLQ